MSWERRDSDISTASDWRSKLPPEALAAAQAPGRAPETALTDEEYSFHLERSTAVAPPPTVFLRPRIRQQMQGLREPTEDMHEVDSDRDNEIEIVGHSQDQISEEPRSEHDPAGKHDTAPGYHMDEICQATATTALRGSRLPRPALPCIYLVDDRQTLGLRTGWPVHAPKKRLSQESLKFVSEVVQWATRFKSLGQEVACQ